MGYPREVEKAGGDGWRDRVHDHFGWVSRWCGDCLFPTPEHGNWRTWAGKIDATGMLALRAGYPAKAQAGAKAASFDHQGKLGQGVRTDRDGDRFFLAAWQALSRFSAVWRNAHRARGGVRRERQCLDPATARSIAGNRHLRPE